MPPFVKMKDLTRSAGFRGSVADLFEPPPPMMNQSTTEEQIETLLKREEQREMKKQERQSAKDSGGSRRSSLQCNEGNTGGLSSTPGDPCRIGSTSSVHGVRDPTHVGMTADASTMPPTHLAREAIYSCKDCGKGYFKEDMLKNHIRSSQHFHHSQCVFGRA